ncbi:MAG: sensor histidine kinase [Prosthecobacter sp.]|uniref:sensor histidine kinase n=1 Tax=Prosthecobacter sp. TaxID=1965333 RepID=UPI0038FE4A02
MMFPESLRLRIQLWHGFLLAAVLTGFAVGAYRYQAANEIHRVDIELRLRVRALTDSMIAPRGQAGRPPPGVEREFKLAPARAGMFEGTDGAEFYYAVWRRDGAEWACSAKAPLPIERPERPKSDEPMQGERTRGDLREAFTFTPPGECMLAGRSIAPELASMRDYSRWLAAIATSVLAFGLVIGWWVTSRAIRPIATIADTARRIATGDLSERIPVRSASSELGHLSTVLNATFAQLESSFARQARFTADAAHELRTPVAIILSQAQRVLTRERDPATYQRTLEACVSAARRLNQLTESMLTLATHDGDAVTIKHEPCDLATIAHETAAPLQPLAEERGITLELDLSPAPCTGDALRLSQIILNLLSNALDHTPDDGRITLNTTTETGRSVFTITDTGCGIAGAHLKHIFDRFYRADESRTRTTGGAGLGLSICKAIADEHSSTLEVTSVEGQGSTFTLRLPRL